MLLTVQELKTNFHTSDGVVRAVDGVSFELEEGKTLCLVGESGCGKSVTALSILRLLASPPAVTKAKTLTFDGMDLQKLSPTEMAGVRGLKIGMIFQEPMTSLNPVMMVGEQIAEVLRVHRIKREPYKEVVSLLEKVGIPDPVLRYRSYPHELSGGMRQRVMIAIALACHPKLLIADEPTTALDVTIQAQILKLIKDLQREMKMAVILITHDLGVVAETADEVIVMYAGKVVERSSVQNLFKNPLHPYTVGLLKSTPSLAAGKRHGSLYSIRGGVPRLSETFEGCSFEDRCELVKEHCRLNEPELIDKNEHHWVSCFEVPKLK